MKCINFQGSNVISVKLSARNGLQNTKTSDKNHEVDWTFKKNYPIYNKFIL